MTFVLILYQLFPRATFKTGSPLNPPTHFREKELEKRRLCMNRIKELVNKSITFSLVKLVSLMRASVSVYKPLMITEPVVPSARL